MINSHIEGFKTSPLAAVSRRTMLPASTGKEALVVIGILALNLWFFVPKAPAPITVEEAKPKTAASYKNHANNNATASRGLPSGLWTYQNVTATPAGRTTRTDFWHLTGKSKGNYVIMKFVTELSPRGIWVKYGELLGDARSFYWTVRAEFEDAQQNGELVSLLRGKSRLIDVQPQSAREAAVHNAGGLLGTQSKSFRYRKGQLFFQEGSELQLSEP
jgi:hypothetical protein